MSRTSLRTAISLLLLFHASWVVVATETNADNGEQLLARCRLALSVKLETPTQGEEAGICLGYVHGVLAMNQLYRNANVLPDEMTFCPPDGAGTRVNGAGIIVKYLESHPSEGLRSSGITAVQAFRWAWPCSAVDQGKGP